MGIAENKRYNSSGDQRRYTHIKKYFDQTIITRIIINNIDEISCYSPDTFSLRTRVTDMFSHTKESQEPPTQL